jgi:hypothetical protein
MDGKTVWEPEAKDGAESSVDGHARLGDYDDGREDLSHKVQVGVNTRLFYDLNLETNELHHPSEYLLVRLTAARASSTLC